MPSTIQEVFQINPFMRVMQPDIQAYAEQTDPVAIMQKLRQEKDKF